jgi:hypothetical protein
LEKPVGTATKAEIAAVRAQVQADLAHGRAKPALIKTKTLRPMSKGDHDQYRRDAGGGLHRAQPARCRRVLRASLGFKSFRSTAATLDGVELMHMIRKGQLRTTDKLRPVQQFYALAAGTSKAPAAAHSLSRKICVRTL